MSNTGPGDDDVLAGTFDQTNGLAQGLEGESDGTADGDVDPGALRDGTMGVAPVDEQDDADAEALQEEEVTGRREGAADSDEGRVP
ncbi:hypothetical protein [Amnibacterium sp.]|jgi:hypothetical protein|uniref:hypothetical protein n=1 Tax=Amnibacterium sp. TaxID=1872496 RepID=UPI00261DD2F4|nr:hypothetical protein [Amnibacterium sp.]MCU1473770.1 hypothetical protein [Amnibacterium sp.]